MDVPATKKIINIFIKLFGHDLYAKMYIIKFR